MTGRLFSPALVSALAMAAKLDPEPCPACVDDASGLCHSERCAKQVLPQLKEPSLKAFTASGTYYEPVPPKAADEKLATDHAQRMARQAEKRLALLGRAAFGARARPVFRRRRARA